MRVLLPPTTRRTAGIALLAAAVVVGGATAAAAEQVLVDVVPGNGASVERVPEQVELTFAESLDGAQVTVSLDTPEGPEDVVPRVQDRTVVIGVPDAGPGSYEVAYTVTPGQAQGTTGFTVLQAGQSAPQEVTASPWWFVTGALLLVGLAVALVRTLRGYRSR